MVVSLIGPFIIKNIYLNKDIPEVLSEENNALKKKKTEKTENLLANYS